MTLQVRMALLLLLPNLVFGGCKIDLADHSEPDTPIVQDSSDGEIPADAAPRDEGPFQDAPSTDGPDLTDFPGPVDLPEETDVSQDALTDSADDPILADQADRDAPLADLQDVPADMTSTDALSDVDGPADAQPDVIEDPADTVQDPVISDPVEDTEDDAVADAALDLLSDLPSDIASDWADDLPTDEGGNLPDVFDADSNDWAELDTVELTCQTGMVLVEDLEFGTYFCMDRYEASRMDATPTSMGTSPLLGDPVEGVVPWWSSYLTGAQADAACTAAAKRLCTAREWEVACSNNFTTIYTYGDDYDVLICNGIDTFCYCGPDEACDGIEPCPYPHCWDHDPDGSPGGCRADWGVWLTGTVLEGSSPCANELGIHDLSGNVWEVAVDTSGDYQFRGGACNCIDSENLHECDTYTYPTALSPNRRGFRCCDDPE